MRKAGKLLSICVLLCLLLAAAPVSVAASGPDALTPPAGTVYAVSPCAQSDAQALTVVDLTLDGADRTDYGVRYDGDSRYYYGAAICRVTYGAVIDGAGTGYFGSSNGTIPLYDGDGGVSGVVWGGCQSTAMEQCESGFLVSGDVTDGILVEDGASIHSREALILCQEGSARFAFNNASLESDSGILLQMDEGAGDVAVRYANGLYRGALVNDSGSALSVTVEKGAVLCGDAIRGPGTGDVTVAAGGTWVVAERSAITRLTVEEGGAVYACLDESAQGELVLLPDDELLDSGVYEAAPLTDTLPLGPGPALPDDAPQPETPTEGSQLELQLEDDQPEAPAQSSQFDLQLEDSQPEAQTEESQPEASEPLSDAWRAARLFPLLPDRDKPAQESAPAQENAPVQVPLPDVPGVDLAAAMPDLAPGLLLSCAPGPRPISLSAPALGLLTHIPVADLPIPTPSSMIKTGIKTHSFLPETIDKPLRILYNPYCCLAA